MTDDDLVENLEEQGSLVASDYKARRAIQVEECEDEGSHYFVELEDGSVLYLNGQYLRYYDPIDFPDQPQPRSFPCTSFTLRRHRESGYTVDIICHGEVLEPEVIVPAFSFGWSRLPDDISDGIIIRDLRLNDGTIITNVRLQQIASLREPDRQGCLYWLGWLFPRF